MRAQINYEIFIVVRVGLQLVLESLRVLVPLLSDVCHEVSQFWRLADEASSLGPSPETIHVSFIGNGVKLIMGRISKQFRHGRLLTIILRSIGILDSDESFQVDHFKMFKLLLHELQPMDALRTWMQTATRTRCLSR